MIRRNHPPPYVRHFEFLNHTSRQISDTGGYQSLTRPLVCGWRAIMSFAIHDWLSFVKSNRLATNGYVWRTVPMTATQSDATSSSASQNARLSPLAIDAARFIAYGAPFLSDPSIILSSGILPTYLLATESVLSVEPLSATMTSHGSDHRCFVRASSCTPIVLAEFKQGIITLNFTSTILA